MSVRVLRVKPGTPYHHSYLDDLESFFWLIVWCVAAHRDSENDHLNPEAQLILNDLNNHNLASMARWKYSLLADCFSAGNGFLEETLNALQNKWARDDLFFTVIVQLGQFFFNVHATPNAPRSPAGVFSQVVDIIQDALASGS
jgi:hypothetical protein